VRNTNRARNERRDNLIFSFPFLLRRRRASCAHACMHARTYTKSDDLPRITLTKRPSRLAANGRYNYRDATVTRQQSKRDNVTKFHPAASLPPSVSEGCFTARVFAFDERSFNIAPPATAATTSSAGKCGGVGLRRNRRNGWISAARVTSYVEIKFPARIISTRRVDRSVGRSIGRSGGPIFQVSGFSRAASV